MGIKKLESGIQSKVTCKRLPSGTWKASVQIGKFKYSVEAPKQAAALRELGEVLECEKRYEYAAPLKIEPKEISVQRMDIPANLTKPYLWQGFHL